MLCEDIYKTLLPTEFKLYDYYNRILHNYKVYVVNIQGCYAHAPKHAGSRGKLFRLSYYLDNL